MAAGRCKTNHELSNRKVMTLGQHQAFTQCGFNSMDGFTLAEHLECHVRPPHLIACTSLHPNVPCCCRPLYQQSQQSLNYRRWRPLLQRLWTTLLEKPVWRTQLRGGRATKDGSTLFGMTIPARKCPALRLRRAAASSAKRVWTTLRRSSSAVVPSRWA